MRKTPTRHRLIALLIGAALTVLASATHAQTIQRDAQGNYIAVKKPKAQPVKTGKTYTDTKGKTWDVYQTESGRPFVYKVSSKTGKEYRYYLPIK